MRKRKAVSKSPPQFQGDERRASWKSKKKKRGGLGILKEKGIQLCPK